MHSLLERALKDRDFYKQYETKVFLVPAKMRGGHLYFNIEKIQKQHRRRQEDKYEYVMNSRFGASQTIPCRVSNEVLKPHFSLPAGEMRKLNRTNRPKSEELVREGGASVKESLTQLHSWQMQFLHSAEAFFAMDPRPTLDGKDPLLMILRQQQQT